MSPSTQSKAPSLNSLHHAFTSIIWPRRKLLAFGLLMIILNRMSGLVLPGSVKFLIDDVIPTSNSSLLWQLIAVVGIAILVQAISSYLLTKLLSIEAQNLIAELRAKAQKHVLRLPIKTFDNTKSGELVSRIMNDVEGVRNLVGTGLVQLIGGTLTAVVAFTLLIKVNLTLTFLALIPLALFGIASMKAFKSLRPTFRKRAEIQAAVTGRLTESLGGIRVIKGFNAEEREEKVFRDGVNRIFENIRKSLTITSAITSSATLLMGVASVMVMGYGGQLIMDEQITLGEFFSFTLYLGFLVAPVMQMANIGTQMTEAFAGLDRMENLLSEPGEDDDPRRTITMPTIKGHVIFENVHFSYEEGKEVLKGIQFEAKPGSVIALVGSSGSGKSTIAGLAASFVQPKSGRVLVDSIDLTEVKLTSFRRQLGLVLQDGFLFDGSIRENILFARPEAEDSAVEEAVEMAHVKEFTDRFENGLNTIIGERGVKLSGGQRQRVGIARALLANPRILILDEATSSLDTESEAYIQESLALLMEGRTTFVIAHRLSTIQKADLILVIEKGEIVERGQHDELIARKGRYHDLYTYQARI